ncbi:MAG: SCP2 sterol-binding domain-containing protein [Myxococcota bacterium]|nr:SCP2 sterol-binding domain-containing protein [Myxococcota bacterium]
MPELPSDPISPQQFMEEFIPATLNEATLDAETDVKLGVQIDGEGGGQWVLHLSGGAFQVEQTAREEAAFTLVQTVEDWRGALWEGRGGVFGQQASALLSGGIAGSEQAPPPNAKVMEQLAALGGLIRVTVTSAEGEDWSTGFKLGPGELPAEPTTEVRIAAEDAEAMQSGSLDPMQAFMSGKIKVIGDMALMMQMQAIAMQAGS